jgi:glycosyltransferase involved in cell wall biosynthesis
MTVSLFSNFFNHHQKPLCDSFHNTEEVCFNFIEMEAMPTSFLKAGYEVHRESYVLSAYKNSENYQLALSLIDSSDVVIFGSVIDKIFDKRIKANKLTFKYSERIFRKPWHMYDPRRIWHLLKHNTRFRNKEFYLLCAGGYVANDFNKVFAFPGKKLKWGYFTKVKPINIAEVLSSKPKDYLRLLYVGRLISLKNVTHILYVGFYLKSKNIRFKIDIIGVGPLLDELATLASDLDILEEVSFKGNLSNKEVLHAMQASHMLFFSSNKEEGWGAVVNEAMANGCPVIIGNKIGSAPFLIQHKQTGLVYNTNAIKELKKLVMLCYQEPEFRDYLATNAYKSISEIWSPSNSTSNFLKFCKTKRVETETTVPMSSAKQTPYNWYK